MIKLRVATGQSWRLVSAATLFFLSVLLAACSGISRPSATHPTAAPATTAAPGFALPFPDDRRAATTGLGQTGQDRWQCSGDAVVEGTDLALAAPDGEARWAVYRFGLPPSNQPSTLVVQLADAFTDEVWLGLANFATGRWDWRGPLTAADARQPYIVSTPPLDSSGVKYVSPTGAVYAAVLVTSPHGAVIQGLNLTTNIIPQPPVASFKATPNTGLAGDPVALDPRASFDSDGFITRYDWDLDGDGSFETAAGSTAVVQAAQLPSPGGSTTVSLRVTDSDGLTTVASQTLTSTDAPWPRTALGNGTAGALLVVDGNPALCYLDGYALYYRRTTSADGTSWGDPVLLDASDYPDSPSLALIGGKPAVAYHTIGEVRYSSALDSSGAAWGTPVAADSLGGEAPRLVEAGGKPGLAYAAFATDWDLPSYLFWVSATDASGTVWNARQSLLPSTDLTTAPSLTLVDGLPALTYGATAGVYYLRAADAAGDTWGTPLLLQAGASRSALAVVAGRPAVALELASDDLAFMPASDNDGAAWGLPVLVGLQGTPGGLAEIDGKPAIALYQLDGPLLYYLAAQDAAGQTWDPPLVVDDVGAAGSGAALAVVNGTPALAYSYVDAAYHSTLHFALGP